MRQLIVGDLHTKYHIFDRIRELGKIYDRVIFLGDYCDDWNAIPEASLNLLEGLKQYKLSNPDKVILLLANHDISEWLGNEFKCSGFNYFTHQLVASFFNKNKDLFQLAYTDGQFLYTHAGLTNSWAEQYFSDLSFDPTNLIYVEKTLNTLLTDNPKDLLPLADVGKTRGGYKNPSIIWADEQELIADPYPISQIVGHTPMRAIQHFQTQDFELYFCDTFSTYSNGNDYGDNSLLEIIDGIPRKMDLDGHNLSW